MGIRRSKTGNTCLSHLEIEHVMSAEMPNDLRAAVVYFGEDVLRIKKNKIGMHSIRLGAAMTMNLGKCPVYTIMMIGR